MEGDCFFVKKRGNSMSFDRKIKVRYKIDSNISPGDITTSPCEMLTNNLILNKVNFKIGNYLNLILNGRKKI